LVRLGRSRWRGLAAGLGAVLWVATVATPAWAAVPDAPTGPTAVAGNAQITVSFDPPNSDSPITGYTATCTDGTFSTPRSGGGSPIVVFGPHIVNGTTYTCTVDATNASGTSAESPSSAAVVPATVPSAPPAPSAVAHDTYINVTFVASANNGGNPITGYTVTCTSADFVVSASTTGTASPLTVAPVTDGKTYTCTAAATNGIGTGPASAGSPPVMPIGSPDAPAPPTITPGTNLMQVAFGAPANNGRPITSYTATCTSTDGGRTAIAAGPASPINVTGLTNGNTYTCAVSATSSAGTSPDSGDSTAAVAIAVPNSPAKPAVAGGPSRITVSFIVPVEKADEIFKTTATCTSSNGGVTRSASTQPEDAGVPFSPIIVTGLTNGKTYTCAVDATNNIGEGPLSPASATVIPRVPPGAPTAVKVVSGNAPGVTGAAVVSFSVGNGNGSAITSFRATCTDLKNGHKFAKTGAKSPLAVTGITTGHAVSCVAVDIGPGGTSPASAAAKATVGAPGQPVFTKISQKQQSVTLTFLTPAANGSTIMKYVAVCTSTNGGAKTGGTSATSLVVVHHLTLNKTYACLVTADNARGASTATKVAPIRITS
jgi:large repetitive protein